MFLKVGDGGWRLADSGWESRRAMGDRKPESLLRTDEPQPIIRSPVSLWILCFRSGWPVAGLLQFSPLLSPPFFQVSGLGHQEPGTGGQVRVRVQEICPLSSVIDSVIHSFRVAGGSSGWPVAGLLQFSPLLSPQRSPLFSPPFFQVSGLGHQDPGTGHQVQVLVQEICPLSSVIDSVIHSFRVAGSGAFQFSPQFSPQRSPPCSPP